MPWSVGDVDGFKKGLTPAQKKKWVSVANGVLKDCQSKGGKDCEGKAIRIANSKFDLVDPDSTWTFDDLETHDLYFGVTEDRKKPGGSNVGKYKKGPFCGPAGGAPKGSYPVNTRKRAISAIAYARHAPNPSGIKRCVCRHWPGLAACKKKEKQMEGDVVTQKVPKGALRFIEDGFHAFAVVEGDKPPRLQMTAYNGKIIKGHWYWGDLAIDLEGMKFPGSKFPILENHMTDRKVGFTSKPDISDGKLELVPEKTKFVSTEAADEFIKLSSEGFPYQASIYAKPTEIQRLMKDETTEVNGMTMRGPGTVWRKSVFKEASVCVFGWDTETKATAFSREETEDVEFVDDCPDCGEDYDEVARRLADQNDNDQIMEGGEIMNLDELKEKHPDLVTQLSDEVKTNLETEFQKERDAFAAEKKKLEGQIEDSGTRLADLEKKDAIRADRERAATADRIWESKLSESDIDESLFDKVKQMVRYGKFVKDDELDVDAFAKAVEDEIADWEKRRSSAHVSGMGAVNRSADGDGEAQNQNAEENKKLTNDLLARAGQEVKTDA